MVSEQVCVDTLVPGGLTPEQLDQAEATWDRLVGAGVVGLSNSGPERPESLQRQEQLASDRGFVELMCHPFFEGVAKQVLKTDAVRVIELGPHERSPSGQPTPGPEKAKELWSNGAHIDFQVTSADFNATPRRDLLGVWLWVNDVPAERGAMRILPGSHRPIMQHWDTVLTAAHKQMLPRCHGMRTHPPEGQGAYPEHIPEPPDWPYSQSEPMPVAVRRGTAQVFTQSMLHSAWPNTDTEPRKGFIIAWAAAEVPVGFVQNRCDGLRNLFALMRGSAAKWNPGREYIVPAADEFKHFVTGYDPAWPETFIGAAEADSTVALQLQPRL
jgi:hypothetical protein